MAAEGPGYYGAPQRPGVVGAKKSSENGCLIWGLAGCGICLLLGVIFIVALANAASKSNSGFGGVIKNTVSAQVCGQSINSVSVAIAAYRTDHKGKYPAKLTDLVPDYLADSATVDCGGTVKELGDKLIYHVPSPKAPDDTMMVEINMGEASFGNIQTTLSYVRILKSGEVVVDQVTRQKVRGTGSRYTPNTEDDETTTSEDE
jgi:hypothetical protein